MAQARANPIENFRLVFADAFMKGIMSSMDDNQDLFKKILDDPVSSRRWSWTTTCNGYSLRRARRAQQVR